MSKSKQLNPMYKVLSIHTGLQCEVSIGYWKIWCLKRYTVSIYKVFVINSYINLQLKFVL